MAAGMRFPAACKKSKVGSAKGSRPADSAANQVFFSRKAVENW
jgi:hypothetical protein